MNVSTAELGFSSESVMLSSGALAGCGVKYSLTDGSDFSPHSPSKYVESFACMRNGSVPSTLYTILRVGVSVPSSSTLNAW